MSLLLALGAVILLITAEMASPYHAHTSLAVNKKKLKNAALASGIIFIITAAIRIISMYFALP